MGRVSRHYLTRGLGSIVSSPSRVSRKLILCIFGVRKKPSGTLFQHFCPMAGPQILRGLGKLSPFPPSRRACLIAQSHIILTVVMSCFFVVVHVVVVVVVVVVVIVVVVKVAF